MDSPFTCGGCGRRTHIKDTRSADIICVTCGRIWGTWSPEHCDGPPPNASYYERKVYFERVLRELLGHDAPLPGRELLHRLRLWMGDGAGDATVTSVKAALSKMKIRGKSKSVGLIAHALRDSGKPFPTLTHYEKESLANMFETAQAIFTGMRVGGRKNIISYHYMLARLMRQIDRYDEFEPYLTNIRTPCKIQDADAIWKVMEEHSPWMFQTGKHHTLVRDHHPAYLMPVPRKVVHYQKKLATRSPNGEGQSGMCSPETLVEMKSLMRVGIPLLRSSSISPSTCIARELYTSLMTFSSSPSPFIQDPSSVRLSLRACGETPHSIAE